jgi:hypothetical protein
MNKLWVDDMRSAPEGWDLAVSSAQALKMLQEKTYDVVSLDHDLGWLTLEEMRAKIDAIEAKGGTPGEYDTIDTTRPIVLHWCETNTWPDEVTIHSSNPVGRQWLQGMIDEYKP